MEEQKRRAEADKLAAITALEQRSRDFMAEKEANRRLEQKIASMQSQLLTGGAALQDTPAFRCRPMGLLPHLSIYRHAWLHMPAARRPVEGAARTSPVGCWQIAWLCGGTC